MSGFSLGDALAAIRDTRGKDDVVITTMGAAREWIALRSDHPHDFVFVPSSMSQATSLGLGLAIARPERRVVVANGDGSMLMNLGSLVTVAAEGPPNLIVIVCSNGVYEVTGAQPVPGAGQVDFAAMARAAGFSSVHQFGALADWRAALPEILALQGPTFVVLDVEAVPGIGGPKSPGPAAERGRRFMAQLTGSINPPDREQ
jgi:thiamine pyrophosphate-dependent acetolactate synthase large subunit-like protein